MRFVQYRILTKILEPFFPIPDYVFAFEKSRSIPTMASVHVGKKVVISVDIKDFFPSIRQKVIAKILAERGFGFPAARNLSELMTLGPRVPQGALTSPKISNIVVCRTFGPEIYEYCQQHGMDLTIYADDITISTNDDSDPWSVVRFLTQTVHKYGFRLNFDKTKVMRSTSRQYVCGAVVNEKVNLLRKERMKLRAIVHHCIVHGLEATADRNGLTPNEFLLSVRGRLNWFGQLNPEAASGLIAQFKESFGEWEEMIQAQPYVPTLQTE